MPLPPNNDEPVSVLHAAAGASGRKIPSPPADTAQWVCHDEEVRIAGFIIRGGMFYLGNGLKMPNGKQDPCLVVPHLPVTDYDVPYGRELRWAPSYRDLHPDQRREYLKWLSGGRTASSTAGGYLSLYLSGLERRVRHDIKPESPVREQAMQDLPHVAAELRGLLARYGSIRLFSRAALSLLDIVELLQGPDPLYTRIPPFPRGDGIPAYIRLALGQCVSNDVPVSADLALAWLKTNPTTELKAPALRCPELFDRLFLMRFAKAFSKGMPVRTLGEGSVSLYYRPINDAIGAAFHKTLNEPEVSGHPASLTRLRVIADAAAEDLAPYSRLHARDRNRAAAIDGLVLLPTNLWPERAQEELGNLALAVGQAPLPLSIRELVARFGSLHSMTKGALAGLQNALASHNIGMEPDLARASKAPGADDMVVLFGCAPGDLQGRQDSPSYLGATLTMELGALVALADGEMNRCEMSALDEQMELLSNLSPGEKNRLRAHLRHLQFSKPSLSVLRARVNNLPKAMRDSLGVFAVSVALVDGEASPDEVTVLEKVFKALALDNLQLYSALHSNSAEIAAVAQRQPPAAVPVAGTSLKLDPVRIAALQEDTAKATALLASLFVSDEPSAATPFAATVAVSTQDAKPVLGLTTLDAAHSRFAGKLVARAQWSRAELLDVASTCDLMLDGALETVNDASFDVHDMPLTEGEDPVKVNQEILQTANT